MKSAIRSSGIVVAVILALSACASLQSSAPAGWDQQAVLRNLQAFANRVTAAYHVGPVRVVAVDTIDGGLASISSNGQLEFLRAGLTWDPKVRDLALSHELGHWVLGHVPGAGPCRPVRDCERAADAAAVDTLAVGRGLSREQAYRQTYITKLRVLRALGSPDPCVEMRDLASRFPYAPPVASGCPA